MYGSSYSPCISPGARLHSKASVRGPVIVLLNLITKLPFLLLADARFSSKKNTLLSQSHLVWICYIWDLTRTQKIDVCLMCLEEKSAKQNFLETPWEFFLVRIAEAIKTSTFSVSSCPCLPPPSVSPLMFVSRYSAGSFWKWIVKWKKKNILGVPQLAAVWTSRYQTSCWHLICPNKQV